MCRVEWMRNVLLILCLIFLFCGLQAQKRTGNSYVGRVMYKIPEASTISTQGIADYINLSFDSQKDKARAIYVWIARNIKYNFDSIITNTITETPAEVSERLLKSRTGVCLNFVNLYLEIARKAGLKSYVIYGYTKQNGQVDYLPHMWCVVKIDSVWSLIDPTWGSGYYYRGKFVNQMSGYYFMTKPEEFIHSHIPFDPMWQLLNYPVSHYAFKRKPSKIDTSKVFFSFNDTIAAWEKAPAIDKARGSARRIEAAGVANEFIAAKVRLFKAEIEYLSNQYAVESYDSAVSKYNAGIRELNRFIGYRNSRLQLADSAILRSILDSAENYLNSAIETINGVTAPQQDITVSLLKLNNAIQNTMMALMEQRRYLHAITPNP